MAAKEFETYYAPSKDSQGNDIVASVEVHEVTEDTAGEVRTRTGVVHTVPGDVLAKTDHADVYDVLKADQWEATEWAQEESEAEGSSADETSSETEDTDSQTDVSGF